MKTSDLADNFGMEDMAFMAWHSAKTQTDHGQSIPVEFDSFVNRLVDIEIVNNEKGKVIPAGVSDIH